jgi:hypothetical protein
LPRKSSDGGAAEIERARTTEVVNDSLARSSTVSGESCCRFPDYLGRRVDRRHSAGGDIDHGYGKPWFGFACNGGMDYLHL